MLMQEGDGAGNLLCNPVACPRREGPSGETVLAVRHYNIGISAATVLPAERPAKKAWTENWKD